MMVGLLLPRFSRFFAHIVTIIVFGYACETRDALLASLAAGLTVGFAFILFLLYGAAIAIILGGTMRKYGLAQVVQGSLLCKVASVVGFYMGIALPIIVARLVDKYH